MVSSRNTIPESDVEAAFSIATTLRCKRGHYSFPELLHFTLDPYFIMLSVKQGGIKYHFLSLWYNSIKPRSPRPLENTLLIRPRAQSRYTMAEKKKEKSRRTRRKREIRKGRERKKDKKKEEREERKEKKRKERERVKKFLLLLLLLLLLYCFLLLPSFPF